ILWPCLPLLTCRSTCLLSYILVLLLVGLLIPIASGLNTRYLIFPPFVSYFLISNPCLCKSYACIKLPTVMSCLVNCPIVSAIYFAIEHLCIINYLTMIRYSLLSLLPLFY